MNHINSLGVSNLLQQIIKPNDVILDLGSYASGTTRAFLKKRCRCYVEDLPVFLNEIKVDDNFSFERALARHLVVLNDDVKLDVILTWDLFHYFDLQEIGTLFRLLKDKLKPGTIVHATRHTGSQIPDKPQIFKLLDDFSYQMSESKADKKIVNHSHATIDILKYLHHFNLYDTLTHKDNSNKGLVEYALRNEGHVRQNAVERKPIKSASVDLSNFITSETYEELKLPNLSKLFLQYGQNHSHCILDCGGPMVSNHHILEKIANMVLEEDLYSAFVWQKKLTVGSSIPLNDQILSYHNSTRFDLVLMWDLLNFVEKSQIPQLIDRLSQHLQPDSLLHMVTPHSRGNAEKPAAFRVRNDFKVEICGDLSDDNSDESLTTGELVRLLPNYKVLSYYFGTLNNGENYQEYIFQYKGQ